MFPAYQTLKTSVADNLLSISLNRPNVRNAMNLKMCEEIIDLFALLQGGERKLVVVIRAEGTNFCAGVDLQEVAAHDDEWVLKRRNAGLDAFLAIEGCPHPVICAVNGPSIGAGCEIAGACDFIIAVEQAFFQWPEALRGNVGATQRLPRAVGRPMAKELLFTARRVSAQEARSIGFVNQVVPAHSLDAELDAYVTAISACSPVALKLIKQAIDTGESLARASAVDIERGLIAKSMQHDEWRVGIAKFR